MIKCYKRYIVSLLLFFSAIPVVAQLQLYKKGIASFEKGYYNLAIRDLSKVKTIDDTEKANLNYLIAESYRLSNKWLETIPYYEKAFEAGLKNDDAQFHYAYALKANAEYEKSLKAFEKYIAAKTTNKVYNERANRELNNLRLLEEINKTTSDLAFQNLKKINTEGAEFAPVVVNGELVFTASRKEKIYSNNLPFLGIYKAKISEDLSTIGDVTLFSDKIFDPERNEGTPAFSPDGKTVVFARSNSGKRKDLSPDVDLYISRKLPTGEWTEPRYVSASDSASWDGCPAFSRNGNTLYFASNRPGGAGGIDIYSVNMDASGRFGNPKNMGKVINTPGDEMFPFVSTDGKLYFASDGHPSLGKLDLFVAVRSGGKIEIQNMGLPFNSALDDFALSTDDVGNIFFSSNRAGGQGDDDIYFYQAPPRPTVTQTTDPTDPVNTLPSTTKTDGKIPAIKTVNYYLAGTVTSQNVSLDSVSIKIVKYTDGIEEVFTELNTAKNGGFGPVKVEEETDYGIIAEKKGYLTKREGFTMYGRSIPQVLLTKAVTDTTFFTTLNLDQIFIGKTFRLENIYYDLDKYDIRADAAIELDKLVQILEDNPTITIELGSHTDSRSSDVYNLRLSQKRAESAINYLVSKGIDKNRLTAKGYGESELIIENAKTEEEHQMNRRTEFKVVSIAVSE